MKNAGNVFFANVGGFSLSLLAGVLLYVMLNLYGSVVDSAVTDGMSDIANTIIYFPVHFTLIHEWATYLLGAAIFVYALRKTKLFANLNPQLGYIVVLALVFCLGVVGMDFIQNLVSAVGEAKGGQWVEAGRSMNDWIYPIAAGITITYAIFKNYLRK